MSEYNYIHMLEESLEKKLDILKQLQILCREQGIILQDDEATPEALEENMDKKQALIDHMGMLDGGFDEIFARVSGELNQNREKYTDNIRYMQDMIRSITDASVAIQSLEERNRELAVEKFRGVRAQVKEVRQSSKVASTYYKNMMNITNVGPQFLDSKK